MYVKANLDKLLEDNLLNNCAEEFLQILTFSDNDRMNIEKATGDKGDSTRTKPSIR